MGTYILRRLLLMLPTLVGITFLVFMLVALSPGGIGAALKQSGGAAQSTSSLAIQEAYLDDRYGLDDSPPMQYVRWLLRISPLKFGQRDLLLRNGERVQPPKAVKPPVKWEWFVDALPQPVPGEVETPRRATLAETYAAADQLHSERRAESVSRNALLKEALIEYAKQAKIRNVLGSDAKLRVAALEGHTPDRTLSSWPAVEKTAQSALEAYQKAVNSREMFASVYEEAVDAAGETLAGEEEPAFTQAGVPVIPGLLSLSAPDLGRSFSTGRPVGAQILDALPVTILINLTAFPLIYLISIPTGMLAAVRRGTSTDSALGMLFIAMWSFPVVLAGVLSLGFLASNQYLGAFPVSGLHDKNSDDMAFLPGPGGRGYLLDLVWHMLLPVLCISYGQFAILSKQTRAAMLDNFNADYVRTAKAKGVPRKDVVFRHVFRNSLLPLITMFVAIFPAMLAGSVVIERIFSVPGMGSLIITAINNRDRELLLANTMMIAAVNLTGLLIADILYALADPRISYE